MYLILTDAGVYQLPTQAVFRDIQRQGSQPSTSLYRMHFLNHTDLGKQKYILLTSCICRCHCVPAAQCCWGGP